MSRKANITKRGNRYFVRWYDASGKRRGKSFAREKDAKNHLAQQNTQREAEREGTTKRRAAGTIAGVCEAWLETRPPARRKDDRSRLDHHILPLLGDKRLADIDHATIERFIRALEKKRTKRPGEKNTAGRLLKPATINNVLITLRKLLNDHDYPTRIKYKVPMAEHKWIRDKADVARFLDACAEGSGEWFRVAAALGVYAGLRKGEVAGLRIDACDFGRGIIRVEWNYDRRCTKGKHVRFVPLAPELADILRKWIWQGGKVGGILRRPGALVVVSPRGPLTEKSDLARKARRACKRAGLGAEATIPFHGTRHTAGSAMAEVASLAKVGAVLGHASPTTTARYAHLSTEHVSQDERLRLAFDTPSADVVPLQQAH